MWKKVISLLLLVLIGISSVCLYRTYVIFKAEPLEFECKNSSSHKPITDVEGSVKRFTNAIQFKTITTGPRQVSSEELLKFINWLQKTYPNVHNSKFVTYERVVNYSLLFTINGSDPTLKPYMLCSHLDVVPVEREKWSVEPFEGIIKDGYIYGRGTIDVKNTLMAIFESLEHLFKNENFQPRRGFFLAFGHDEEGSGLIGANEMARILEKRNVQLEYILDEGSFILNQSFPGVQPPIAFIGVAEKGFLTLELKVNGETGHSSMPPKNTPIVRMANALAKINADALPSMFGKGPESFVIESLVPHASFPFNVLYANQWLFSPLLYYFFNKSPMGNSLIRTTSVPTIVNGGFKENVLPSEVRATINHRVHPSQSVAEIIELDKNLINDDEVQIHIGTAFEPHPYSPYDKQSFGFQMITRSVRQVFTESLVAPGIMLASTDTKHYLNLTNSIYRFSPAVLKPEETKIFHGHDERIPIDNYLKIINFYHHLILQSDEASLKIFTSREEL